MLKFLLNKGILLFVVISFTYIFLFLFLSFVIAVNELLVLFSLAHEILVEVLHVYLVKPVSLRHIFVVVDTRTVWFFYLKLVRVLRPEVFLGQIFLFYTEFFSDLSREIDLNAWRHFVCSFKQLFEHLVVFHEPGVGFERLAIAFFVIVST